MAARTSSRVSLGSLVTAISFSPRAASGRRDHGDGEPQAVLRECAGQGVLDRGEADHFAADLRKALQPAQDEEEAIGIHFTMSPVSYQPPRAWKLALASALR